MGITQTAPQGQKASAMPNFIVRVTQRSGRQYVSMNLIEAPNAQRAAGIAYRDFALNIRDGSVTGIEVSLYTPPAPELRTALDKMWAEEANARRCAAARARGESLVEPWDDDE